MRRVISTRTVIDVPAGPPVPRVPGAELAWWEALTPHQRLFINARTLNVGHTMIASAYAQRDEWARKLGWPA